MLSEKGVLDALPDRETKVSEVARAVNGSRELVFEILLRLERRGCVTLRKPWFREHRVLKTGIDYVEECRTIAVLNLKGGVGKTVTALNLAACLADFGQRTLLVDLDPQANASTAMRVKAKTTLYDVLVGTKNPSKAIHKSGYENLYVIPSEVGLAGAEVEVMGVDAAYRLWEVLEWVKDEYRYVIIDCPPSLSLLSVNALTAADSVLIPVQCDQFALDSLAKLMETIEAVKSINEKLRVEGILLTMYEPNSEFSVSIAKIVEKQYHDLLYGSVIARDHLVGEAVGFGVPIIYYKRDSDAAKSYIKLAEEVIRGGR